MSSDRPWPHHELASEYGSRCEYDLQSWPCDAVVYRDLARELAAALEPLAAMRAERTGVVMGDPDERVPTWLTAPEPGSIECARTVLSRPEVAALLARAEQMAPAPEETRNG